MTIQKSVIFLLALAIVRCEDYVVALISDGSAFHPTLSITNHNKYDSKFETIYSNRLMPISSSSSSHLAAISKRRSDEDEDEQDHLSNSSSRRSFILQRILVPAATLTVSLPAYAKYGSGTSMELPSYIDYLIEKNTGTDNSKALYTGADPATVLRRLAESESRLGEIEELAEQKKWSQINGIITGPLGTLFSTMNQIVSIVSSSSPKRTKQVQDAVKKVKTDIFAIGQAADRKNADGCKKQAEMASSDLKALLEIAFE